MWKQLHKVSFKTIRYCKLQLLLQAMFFSRYMMKNVMAGSFSFSSVTDSLQPHGLQHTQLPWPSPTPGACSNWCPLSQWCHSTISSSVTHFSSCPQSFLSSRPFSELISFRMDWLDLLAVQGTVNSLLQHHSSKASILWTQLSSQSNSHIHTWPLEKP